MKKVYVIGAGPSGLIAAYELLKKGVEVIIFEQTKYIGGMCRTWNESSYLLDTGPHIYHTPDKNLELFWKDLFGDLLVEGEFWSKNTVGGKIEKLIDYPLSWESLKNFDEPIRTKIFTELKDLNQNSSKGATNFDEYVENLVGRTLTDMFFKNYPEKVWGRRTTELTADWAPKRIEIRESITPFYHKQFAAVGKYGTGCIYEKLAEEIKLLGGKIYLDERVTKFELDNGFISGFSTEKNEFKVSLQETIISTMPITILGRALGVKSKLEFRGIASVYIGLPKGEINWPNDNVHWLYFDHSDYFFNRITNSSKLSPEVAPEGYELITVESTYSKGDELDSLSKKDLEEIVFHQVINSNLISSEYSENLFLSSNREDYVYPLQNREYQNDLAKINSEIGKYQNLYSIGTGGDFNYADSQVLFYKAFDLVNTLMAHDNKLNQTVKTRTFNGFRNELEIAGKKVGDNFDPIIIGEIGLNHNGNLDLAKKLIDAAVESGLKFVKLQKYKSGKDRVSDKVKSANYVEKITDQEETLSQMFDKFNLTVESEIKIFEYARSQGLTIFSTPFDIESAEVLYSEFKVDCFKIASVDLVNLPLIKKVASYNKPVILSCGMSSLGDIEDAVNVFREVKNDQLILLHCNSAYPAPLEDMNLNVIKTLKNAFKVPVGLSDHTFGLLASTISMSLGANVIERHFTLDRFMDGPDHILSSEPEEMKELVNISKTIKIALGDGIKRIQPGEYLNLNLQRKCVYANKDLEVGHILTLDDLVVKGPGGGILPKYLDIIIGKKVMKKISEDHPITWEVI